MAAVVKDRQDAATVLAADEHDNVFIGESVHNADAERRTGRLRVSGPGRSAHRHGARPV